MLVTTVLSLAACPGRMGRVLQIRFSQEAMSTVSMYSTGKIVEVVELTDPLLLTFRDTPSPSLYSLRRILR